MLQDSKLIDTSFLYEVGQDSIDPKAESSQMHEDDPIEIGLLKNLQESSHLHENRQIEFDLDCPGSPSHYLGVEFPIRDSLTYNFTHNLGRTNEKLKIILED